MIKGYLKWLAFVAVMVVISAVVKNYSETDAEKKAGQAEILTKFLQFSADHDKTGQISKLFAYTSLMETALLECKKIVVPADPGATATEDDKNKYCGCFSFGMNKLYFSTLSESQLIAQSKLPDPKDQTPADIRKKVFADCSRSIDAYPIPQSSQP